TWQRIVVAASLVGSAGVFMGMALPTGIRVAASSASGLLPWLWGINGATSVLGSVLAAAIALAYGISTSYWVGVMCYAWAVAALALKWRRYRTESLQTGSRAAKAPAIGIALIRPLDTRRLQTAE